MTDQENIGRTGGQIVVASLIANGVNTVYCVPGESFLPVLEALRERADEIRTITCRHEANAANMAEAHGKLTGRPGVCLVTRGPGAMHASIAVHTARQDSTPMIMLVGQAKSSHLGRETFQEVDYERTFGDLAKHVEQAELTRRLPEVMQRAFRSAVIGRPGPAVVSLPEDVLYGQAQICDLAACHYHAPAPTNQAVHGFAKLLGSTRRRLIIAGGPGWNATRSALLQEFARRTGTPVCVTFRRQDALPNTDSYYVGDLSLGVGSALAETVRDAELLIVLGARLNEVSTAGYTIVKAPRPTQLLVHVHTEPSELYKVFDTDLAVNAGVEEFMGRCLQMIEAPEESLNLHSARAGYLESIALPAINDRIDLARVVRHVSDHTPQDAVITNGAGNYTVWVHRYYNYGAPGTQLAPTSGAMGYGVPAAIAAALQFPKRTVVCFAGDGCFLMSAMELATVAQYGLGVIFIVVNNGMYGTIRMHQEKHYPDRPVATDLQNPDFVALARSFGLEGGLAETNGEFEALFNTAVRTRKATLIEIRSVYERILPTKTLIDLRSAA